MSGIFTVAMHGEDSDSVIYKKLQDNPTKSWSMDMSHARVGAEPDPNRVSPNANRTSKDYYYKYDSFQFGNKADGGAYLMAPTWGGRKRKRFGFGRGKLWNFLSASMKNLKIGKKRNSSVSPEDNVECHSPIEDRGSFTNDVENDHQSFFVHRSKKRKTRKQVSKVLRTKFSLWANSVKDNLQHKSKSRHENGAFPTSKGSFPCHENYSLFGQNSN